MPTEISLAAVQQVFRRTSDRLAQPRDRFFTHFQFSRFDLRDRANIERRLGRQLRLAYAAQCALSPHVSTKAFDSLFMLERDGKGRVRISHSDSS